MKKKPDVNLLWWVQIINGMTTKLKELQKTAGWINQEENQLKYPVTLFPEMAEIGSYIDPYVRLYCSIANWRKCMKRWLDGDFSLLNSEVIENQTDEMSREMFKLQKVFRARCKQQQEGGGGGGGGVAGAGAGGGGMILSRANNDSINQSTAPLRMCHRGLEDVKQFKVN